MLLKTDFHFCILHKYTGVFLHTLQANVFLRTLHAYAGVFYKRMLACFCFLVQNILSAAQGF